MLLWSAVATNIAIRKASRWQVGPKPLVALKQTAGSVYQGRFPDQQSLEQPLHE